MFLMVPIMAWAEGYIVKRDDTLSGIARAHFGKPIYGNRGSLARLLALNPKHSASPDAIYPGQRIELPTSSTKIMLGSDLLS